MLFEWSEWNLAACGLHGLRYEHGLERGNTGSAGDEVLPGANRSGRRRGIAALAVVEGRRLAHEPPESARIWSWRSPLKKAKESSFPVV
jgi:hypothetical protein